VSLVGPSLLLVLGAALGAATQMSPAAAMGLRVPALFAALFMVAQGLYEVERVRRRRPPSGDGTAGTAASGDGVDGLTAGMETARPMYRATAPTAAASRDKARAAIPALLMGLAGWLGLAVLSGAGNDAVPLSVLATLSAFLLFAIGWQVLLGSG